MNEATPVRQTAGGVLAVETGCPRGGHNLSEAHFAGGHTAYGEVLQEQEQESAAGN